MFCCSISKCTVSSFSSQSTFSLCSQSVLHGSACPQALFVRCCELRTANNAFVSLLILLYQLLRKRWARACKLILNLISSLSHYVHHIPSSRHAARYSTYPFQSIPRAYSTGTYTHRRHPHIYTNPPKMSQSHPTKLIAIDSPTLPPVPLRRLTSPTLPPIKELPSQ